MRQRQGDFPWLRLAGEVLLTWVALAGALPAQEPGGPVESAPKTPAAATPAAQALLPSEVEPQVYQVPDSDGKLQVLLGFTLEDVTELLKIKNQLAQQNRQPAFSIQNLTLSGSADSQQAELVAQYSVMIRDAGWVGVPLRLNEAVLLEPVKYEGPGEHFMHVEPHHGYVIWIRGEAGKTHQVTLKLLTKLTRIGPEAHLRLSVPRDVTLSHMRLTVPLERAAAKVSESGTLEAVRPLENGKTELNVIGLGGELDLAWHAADAQVASLPTVLEATGAVQIRINGRSVESDAKLNVRSLGGQFDRFQVRLPPGADYTGSAQTGVSLVAVDPAAVKGKIYEVKLEKKTTGPVEIRLVTQRTHNSPQADESLELAGFEVLGAVRQWGTVAVGVEGNWQILWGETNHGQIDELTGPLRPDDRSATFEYFVQPYSLTARVVAQKTRVRVEPEYMLLIGSDEAQLRAKLKYTIRGAKIRALELDLSGWEVDSVGPENLVDPDAANTSQTHPFSIPLLQSSSGELELTLEAHQKIAAAAGRVALELPRPHGEVIAGANVAVLPADNIELAVQPDDTTALTPQMIRPQIKLPDRQQDPLYFRAESAAAKLVASIKVHEQAIAASVTSRLVVDERETRVEEQIAFTIAYQPTDHLMLSVPRTLRAERLKITLDGQRLAPASPREQAQGDAEVVPMRVTLPAGRIGRCELEVSYVVRHAKTPDAARAPIAVPLVMPGEGQLTTNELIVVPKAGISVSYSKGEWSEDARHRPAGDRGELALSARRAIANVTLAISSTQPSVAGATTVQRAWIQTRLSDTQRQDRATYLLTTNESRLQLSLPAEADLGSLELAIDSRKVTPDVIHQHEVTVSLPRGTRGEYLLEIDYHFTSRPPPGSLAIECPKIMSAKWVQQLYWQLSLPATEHLFLATDHFTREFRWAWSDFFWSRRPSLDQAELQSWIGTQLAGDGGPTTRESHPLHPAPRQVDARSMNQYLFSTAGTVEPLEVYTLSRARLVLGASLPLLVGGLLLIYFPAARHAGLLFVLAVLLVAGSFVDPELTLLVAQASSLGLVLAIVTALIARMSKRPAMPSAVAVHGSSKAIVERSVTEMYQRGPTPGSQPSTATNPLVPATSSPEAPS